MKKTKSPRRHWWLLALALVGIVCAAIAWARGDLDLNEIVETLTRLNPFLAFALMALLPVGGFSVMVVYLVAGAKFGPIWGGVVVAGATAVHLLASYWISRTVLRGPIERFLKRRGHKLPHVPEGENVSVAAMAVLVPGVPYCARNYLLALTDVPLRTYFWVCLPLYVARSYVTILLGDLGTEPDRRTLIILVAVYAVKLSICAYLIWRIRRRLKETKAGKGRSRAQTPTSA